MIHQTLIPTNEADWLAMRAKDLTSTEVACLFDASPYKSRFLLWHEKRGNLVPEFTENERTVWGTRLQDSIAAGIAADQGWTVRRRDEYQRIEALRLGSSFDFEIAGGNALLEIKNVDGLAFRDNWTETESGLEAPVHIELQVQHQMLVSGLSTCYIGALVGGNSVKLTKREVDPRIRSAILNRSAAFWKSIDEGIAPAPDFSADLAALSRLHNFAEPGKILDATGNDRLISLVDSYKEHSNTMKNADEMRDACKAELLTLIGDAEKITAPGFTISASMVEAGIVKEHTRAAYRGFRVNMKKAK